MSCKSAIYAANQSQNSITISASQPNVIVPIGTVIRRFGCDLQLSGNGIIIDNNGYYDVQANVTMTPAAAGDYTMTLLKDGTAVPGATQQINATEGNPIGFNIPAIVRQSCCSSSVLSLAISTTAELPATATIDNVGIVVEGIS